ncbi:CU044_2847 family protein [Streptomyces sp. B8F3]|uniref:CU044_2847 family protein n=1 Tax=Streptomyces sp. B8F3 TaxID=3153573 RepID=UPI00325E7E86
MPEPEGLSAWVERLPLEGGGEVLFAAATGEVSSAGGDPGVAEGPVKAGRLGGAVRELPRTLQEALVPVRELSAAVVGQLRDAAGPAEVEVEFGVDLSAQAGAIISSGKAAAHLRVRLLWQNTSTDDGV